MTEYIRETDEKDMAQDNKAENKDDEETEESVDGLKQINSDIIA